MFRRHPLLTLATFAYLGLVGWLTLGPQPLDASNDSWLFAALKIFSRHQATSFITYDRVEFGANIAMFVPVGVFFLLLFGRRAWFVAVVAGFVLTCAIEFTQLFLPGRVSDIRDIISNSTGALIGVLLALALTASKARKLRAARRARTRARTRARPATR
jgi:glycopeptide antibiotics resistance protein